MSLHGLDGNNGITALDLGGNVYRVLAVNRGPELLNLGLRFARYAGQCGLTFGGAAFCWGNNESGAVGDGILGHSTIPVPVASSLRFAR
jgi:hypothetical protein